MTAAEIQPGKLEIGRVVQQTFAVLSRRPVLFFGLTFVLAGLPAALNAWLQAAAKPGAAIILSIPFVVIGSFLEGAVIGAALGEVAGRKVEPAEIASTGGKFFLPLLLINILSGFGIVLASFLLFVPGMMLATAWCVAGPALVAERRPLMSVFGRSADLTRGNRWRVFGLIAIYFVLLVIIEGVVGAFSVARMAAGAGVRFSPMFALEMGLVNTVNAAITTVGVAVLYVELRSLRGGLGGDAAKVFD